MSEIDIKCKFEEYDEMVSYNNGQTWQPTGEKRIGELLEFNSEDCGNKQNLYQERWVEAEEGEYWCIGNAKYSYSKKQVSKDGTNWEDSYPLETKLGNVLEEESSECQISDGTLIRFIYEDKPNYDVPCIEGNEHIYYPWGPGSYMVAKRNIPSDNDFVSMEYGECFCGFDGPSPFFPLTSKLKEVTIPDNVFVGASVFRGNNSIEKLYIGSGVKYDINDSTGVTSDGYEFAYMGKLTDLTIADDASDFGSNAFYGSSNLCGEFRVPNSITRIRDGFLRNTSVSSVIVGDNVTRIDNYAFGNDLEYVKIESDKLGTIGNGAFGNYYTAKYPIYVHCDKIKDYASWFPIGLVERLRPIEEDCDVQYTPKIKLEFHIQLATYQTVTIPCNGSNVLEWRELQVLSYRSVSKILYYGDCFDTIGVGTFSGCSFNGVVYDEDLGKEIDYRIFSPPNSIKYIKESAFLQSSGITTVDLRNSSVIDIEASTFNQSKDLTTVFGGGVRSIGNMAFNRCSNLTTLDLPNVASISNNAFADCSGFTTLDLPNIEEIGYRSFANCSSLERIHFGKLINNIGENPFDGIKSGQLTIVIDSTTPPKLYNNRLGYTPKKIIVPCSAVETYKNASGWSSLSSLITCE